MSRRPTIPTHGWLWFARDQSSQIYATGPACRRRSLGSYDTDEDG